MQISKPSVATLHAQTVTDPYTYVSSASSDATTAGFDLYGSPNATCVMLVPFGGASFAFITPWDTENYAASSIFLGLPALLTSRVSTAS